MTAVLGLGLAAVGRPAYINLGHGEDLEGLVTVADFRQRAHALLDEAWALGLRHIDAARSYGLAELFLGEWLRMHPERRAELTIGSKWGYRYVGRWRRDAEVHEIKRHTLHAFERQRPESWQLLGGAPELYLIHSVTPDSPALTDPALAGALAKLAATGVRIGISTSGPRQAETIRRALASGIPFSAVQSSWNVLEPSAGPALAEARANGWHVTLKEGVANGRLTPRAGSGLDHAAAAAGVGVDALALAAALATPFADVVLSGASTLAHLRANAAATAVAPDVVAALPNLAEAPDAYWGTRSSLAWQ